MAISRRKKLLREEKLKKEAEARRYEKKFESNVNLKEFRDYVPQKAYYRETPYIPSASVSNEQFYAEKKEAMQYGGDYLVGIATLHKSNMVPVGKDDSPESYAQMRRN